jgi:short-subunit dehydrogenase
VNETRVAIVTGASSGIGRALAERAVRAGWNVFAVGRRAERLAELAERLAAATGELATLTLDLRSPGAAARIASEALARFGRIDVLVNNAGGVAVGPIAQQSDDALYEQMETHTIVPLALTREALPALRASRGQIFYVGSGVARIPVGTLGAYPPAKAAVRNLARIVRNELHDDGIAVTYVDPGAVATEFMTRVGFAGPPPGFAASPHAVARRIFAAFASRQPVVNAVPWQTFVVAIGEALPGLTDFVLQRAPQIVGGEALPPAPAQPVLATEERKALPAPELTPAHESERESETASSFEAALAPLESRMGRLKLQRAFVAGLLVPGSRLELGDVALRWAGMPNKNERGLTHDVLEALTASGFLERSDDDQFTVVRAANDEPSLPEL